MRWLLALGASLVLAPAAQAATIAHEGTELVYRSAPGQEDSFFIIQEDGLVRVTGDGITPGEVRLPLAADLGPGKDTLNFTASSAAVDAGPGADDVDAFNAEHATGPFVSSSSAAPTGSPSTVATATTVSARR